MNQSHIYLSSLFRRFYSPSCRQSLITLCSQYWSYWPKLGVFQLWCLWCGGLSAGTHHTPRLAIRQGAGEVCCCLLLLLVVRLQAPGVWSWDWSTATFSHYWWSLPPTRNITKCNQINNIPFLPPKHSLTKQSPPLQKKILKVKSAAVSKQSWCLLPGQGWQNPSPFF